MTVGSRDILPLMDIVFLTLGSLLVAMTQMERITAMPVAVARVGPGVGEVHHGELEVLVLTADEMWLGDEAISVQQLEGKLGGKDVLLRANRAIPTERTFAVLGELRRVGADVLAEVQDGPDGQH